MPQRFLNAFAIVVTLLIMAFFVMVVNLIGTANSYAHDVMLTLVGTLSGAFMTIIGFYFGSSKSSSEKNDVIQRALSMSVRVPPDPAPGVTHSGNLPPSDGGDGEKKG
jgi:hypothetical protein